MQLLKFIQRKVFPQKKVFVPNEFKSEDDYYTYFFTKHPKWSKPTPNKAEQERWDVIEKLINQINSNKNIDIIDFGCGRGWLTNKLSKFGNVTGIEPVENVVNYARKLFPSLEFIVGSIEQLQNTKVNLLVSSEVIEHINDDEKPIFFNAFNEALLQNGYCIITTPRAEVQQEWLNYRDDNGQPIEKWLSEDSFLQLATNSGFSIISKNILQERANGPETPMLDLYQIWLIQKNVN